MNDELSGVILSALIFKPSLLESSDICADDFPAGLRRKVFSIIVKIWEDERPGEIDQTILAAQLDKDEAAYFCAEIMGGRIRLEPDIFRRRLAELRRIRFSERIVQESRKLGETHLRTGAFDQDGFTKLRRLIETQDELSTTALPPSFILLSDIAPQPVPWLWPNFIPLGRASLISGDPDSGKTWFVLDLAARLSKGLSWPNGIPGPQPARTVYMSVEDEGHDTIRPRIDSLGGDASQIKIYNSDHPIHLDLSTSKGLRRLEKDIASFGDVRLVVIDPILDFSGGVNPNAGEEVRALLTPLSRIASKMNFALVMIGHLNKAQSLNAIYRAGGSTSGWLGKCRAAFMIFRDIDDKKLRHVIPLKANLAPLDPPQLEFNLRNGRLDIRVSHDEVNPEEHLNPQPGRRPRERENAEAWLKTLFKDRDSIPAAEIEILARKKGFSFPTLKRAKHLVGLSSKKRKAPGGEDAWFWAKPQGDQDAL